MTKGLFRKPCNVLAEAHFFVAHIKTLSQASDTVPRQQLWSHLRHSAMPSTLLSVIKHMYENDEYILMDGEKRARVHPTNGVKQGCPLSPLLFSLYINDMGREISEGIEGAVTGD